MTTLSCEYVWVDPFVIECENFRWQVDTLLGGLYQYGRLFDRHVIDRPVEVWMFEGWIEALRATIARMEKLP